MKPRILPFHRFAFGLARFLERFTGNKSFRKKVELKILNHLKKGPKGKRLEIERVASPSPSEFYNNFLVPGKPCIITGVANHWECFKKWDFQYLSNKYGDDEILLMDTISTDSIFDVRKAKLGETLKKIEAGEKNQYIRFNGLIHKHPELINDVDQDYLFSLRNKLKVGNTYQLFIGAKDSKTDLHAATPHNLWVAVKGRKKWRLYSADHDPALGIEVNAAPYFSTKFNPSSPDYKAFPAVEYLDYYECELQPGEILYNPSSFWHYVENLDPSIGFGFRWFGLLGSPKINFSQSLLSIISTNPSVFFVMKNRRDYSKIFKKIYENNKLSND